MRANLALMSIDCFHDVRTRGEMMLVGYHHRWKVLLHGELDVLEDDLRVEFS